MAKAIIVYDTPYSPTDEQWVEWLAKPQWTAAEAAALSLNILPDFTRVTIALLPHTLAPVRITDDGIDVSDQPSYRINLIDQARVAGVSVEATMQLRTQSLATNSTIDPKSEWAKFSSFNMHKPLDRPNTIAEMQRWEWNIPAAMIGQPNPQSVAESIGESLMPPVVEKSIKVVSRLLSQKDVKNATLDEFYAECNIRHRENNWPEKLHTLDMLFFYQHKDPPTIARMMKRGEVPRPTIPSKKGSARRWELNVIRKHEAEQQARGLDRQAALDAIDKNL